MACAVIMAGGQGERFWPLTHKYFPKYRIRFDGKTSLLLKTYQRLRKVYPQDKIFVVTTRDQIRMIREELRGLKPSQIFVEPLRRNTGPAIFLATSLIAKRFGEKTVVTFYPADHLIKNEALFMKTVRQAIRLAEKKEMLVTIGIAPTFPATGYGYIEMGRGMPGFSGAYFSKRFVEKPNRQTAQRYLATKRYLWNGGIFTWRSGVFLETLAKYSPQLTSRLDLEHLQKSYRQLPKISIDVALLEKAKNIALIKTDMDWCDMGSWDMFFEKEKKGRDKNLILGLSKHKDSRQSLLLNYSHKPLITLGVSDLIVVQTEQGTLICKKSFSEEAARLSSALPNKF